LTITYEDQSEEVLEISSTQTLTEALATLKATGISNYANLIQLSRSIDSFLRANDIKKLEFEEEAE